MPETSTKNAVQEIPSPTTGDSSPQSTHRVAMADFWRTSQDDGKSALADQGGGSTPTPFQPIAITYKVTVFAPAERADTYFSSFISTLYVLCGPRFSITGVKVLYVLKR
jgi:hypothetical protein